MSTYTIQQFKIKAVREKTFKVSAPILKMDDVADFVLAKFGNDCFEYVAIVALNNSNEVIGVHKHDGTTNQCALYPSEVFRFLLLAGASSFILLHNHPGNSTIPSEADWNITKHLQKGAEILIIHFLDHIIITDKKSVSLRQDARW